MKSLGLSIEINYLLASVPMATSSIMPIDSIFLIKLNSWGEVGYSLVIVEEAIPDEAPTVISWCILWIQLDHFVEICEGKLKSITTNLLPDRAQMMYCLNIIRL